MADMSTTPPTKPIAIFILSGKRKSGKDYVGNLLQVRLGFDKSVIIRLSGPLKKQYAEEHNLDFEKLLDASSYKEDYRDKMILWGEEIRCRDPGYFCRHAIQQSQALDRDIWIVSDARRHSDIRFFKDNFGNIVQVVRIVAQDDVRQSRGWSFVKGVDDAESECGLDDYQQWDFLVTNNNNKNDVEKFLQEAKILTDSLFRNGLTNT